MQANIDGLVTEPEELDMEKLKAYLAMGAKVKIFKKDSADHENAKVSYANMTKNQKRKLRRKLAGKKQKRNRKKKIGVKNDQSNQMSKV